MLETPPLTRGRQHNCSARIASSGNTPAYAGKTTRSSRKSPFAGKHPRLHGEDLTPASTPDPLQETPPLTRGRHVFVHEMASWQRNTPAYAGKTRTWEGAWNVKEETPPLTRGRPCGCLGTCPKARNTPAYAGKTKYRDSVRDREWKHPRLRGEDASALAFSLSQSETPPLTRGRLLSRLQVSRRAGNTPAYAGKTPRTRRGACRDQKHPRLRGEDKRSSLASNPRAETPPLTRGRPASARTSQA